MKSYRRVLIFFLCIGVGAVIYFLGVSFISRDMDMELYQVSYICRGDASDDSLQVTRQGMELAANDFNIEFTMVHSLQPHSAQDQIELIQKEVKNNTDAILIEPINAREVGELLKRIQSTVPVVLVNSSIDGYDEFPIVQGDHAALGSKLAEVIIGKEKKRSGEIFLVHSEFYFYDIEEKYNSIYKTLAEQNREIKDCVLSGSEKEREKKVIELMDAEKPDKIVAFEARDLEMIGKLKKDNERYEEIEIYGIGRTNQIVSYVEEGNIQSIGVYNDYSVAYLSIQTAVNLLINDKKEKEIEIGFSIVNEDNVYTTENQRLLFPFVQ